ncbi:MAG: serine/threonine protein kinase [Granulosicoccus sp.]|jgi:serine/threonine protein kinase
MYDINRVELGTSFIGALPEFMDNTAPHPLLKHGEMLNWYRIERVLGRGGFGVIYLATDTNLQHQVAIKEYRVLEQAAAFETNATGMPKLTPLCEGMLRFIDEARNLVRFKHPNIVRVISVFQLNDTAYIVMEFEEGIDLRAHLRISENVTESALKSMVVPIADGLAQVHQTGFIHRDIKPANILVRIDGSPVLLDFGSARNSSPVNTEPLTALVSAGFAPFEQYSGGSECDQGPWTDIYALGAVLYFAVTGIEPVDSAKRGFALLNGGQDPLIKVRMLGQGEYTPAFLSAIDWALQFRISDRPQSLSVWMDALLRLPTTDQATKKVGNTPVINREAQKAVQFENDVNVVFLHDQPVPNEVLAAQLRRSSKGSYTWLGTAIIILVGISVTVASWFLLSDGADRFWQYTNTVYDGRSIVHKGKNSSRTDNAFIDNATLQYELASARNKADALAAELLREQEKIKTSERARLLAKQKQMAEEEAAKIVRLQAESAAKLAQERAQRRRITQSLDLASHKLDLGRFDDAEVALDIVSSLDRDNNRLIQLRARWQAALEISRAPVSDQEFDSVVSHFDELRRAIQAKDVETVNRMTSASSQNELFALLTSRFSRLELSIDTFKLNNTEKSISATLRIDRMVRDTGDFSIPSDAYRERRLFSQRIGRQWSLIQW